MSRFFPICVIAATCFLSLSTSHKAHATNEKPYTNLTSIIQLAFETNPALLAARQELNAKKEAYPQARSGWLPTLGAESSIYATDIDNSNFGSGDGATTKEYAFTVDQPLIRGGKTFAETAQAKDSIKAAQAVLLAEEHDLYLETVDAYTSLVRDRNIMRLRHEFEQIMQQEHDAATERFNLGVITKTYVTQAKARYAKAMADTAQAKADLASSEARFEDVTGFPAPAYLEPANPDIPFPATIDSMVALADTQNPHIIAAIYEQKAAEHEIDVNIRDLFPQIYAFASHNKQYDPQPGIISDSETDTIGIRAKIAFYQGGAAQSRIREARYNAKKHEAEILDVKRQVRQDVKRHWNNFLAAKKQTQSRYLEIDAAQASLEGINEEVNAGQRPLLDLLDAERDLIDAKIATKAARRNEVIAQYALASTLGMLVTVKPEK